MSNRLARRPRQTTVVRPTTIVRRISPRETARSFSLAIKAHTPRELADAADVTIEAAKFWLEGRRAPNATSLLNLANQIPAVRAWTLQILCVREAPEFMSDQLMTAMMAALHQVAHQDGPDGDAVRSALHRAHATKDIEK